jgi:hypothetical protein
VRLAGNLRGGTLLAGVLLAGCASGVAVNTGPFGNGGSQGEECVPLPRGGVLSYGFDEFRNSSASAAVIEKVSLADPHGLRILAAYVVPITGHTLYGVLTGFPPEAHLPLGVQWSQRQRADGATIPHSLGHRVTNLILVLKPVTKIGSARGIDVYYRVSGQQYHLRTATRIVVRVGSTCP